MKWNGLMRSAQTGYPSYLYRFREPDNLCAKLPYTIEKAGRTRFLQNAD
ncbi:hypothetical protein [Brevibacillus parabrevis]|nr:hypothetical protein [Brevibacillus parabrevis]